MSFILDLSNNGTFKFIIRFLDCSLYLIPSTNWLVKSPLYCSTNYFFTLLLAFFNWPNIPSLIFPLGQIYLLSYTLLAWQVNSLLHLQILSLNHFLIFLLLKYIFRYFRNRVRNQRYLVWRNFRCVCCSLKVTASILLSIIISVSCLCTDCYLFYVLLSVSYWIADAALFVA